MLYVLLYIWVLSFFSCLFTPFKIASSVSSWREDMAKREGEPCSFQVIWFITTRFFSFFLSFVYFSCTRIPGSWKHFYRRSCSFIHFFLSIFSNGCVEAGKSKSSWSPSVSFLQAVLSSLSSCFPAEAVAWSSLPSPLPRATMEVALHVHFPETKPWRGQPLRTRPGRLGGGMSAGDRSL